MSTILQLLPATSADYPVLAAVVQDAFEEDKLAYGRGPGLYENPEGLLPMLERGSADVLKLVAEEETIGMVITVAKTPNARWLGCLCLLPAWQGRGYGRQALQMVEEAYPNVYQWGLDTPTLKQRNRRFYECAGYRVVGESEAWEGFKLLVFEKRL